jgi:hypothetical protein
LEEGYRALRVMETHLQSHRYFVADRYTIVDIALYAYTHLAHTCDFDLTAFPAVRAWLARIAEQPGHVLMDEQPPASSQMGILLPEHALRGQFRGSRIKLPVDPLRSTASGSKHHSYAAE